MGSVIIYKVLKAEVCFELYACIEKRLRAIFARGRLIALLFSFEIRAIAADKEQD